MALRDAIEKAMAELPAEHWSPVSDIQRGAQEPSDSGVTFRWVDMAEIQKIAAERLSGGKTATMIMTEEANRQAKLTALLNEHLAKHEADLTRRMQAEFDRRMQAQADVLHDFGLRSLLPETDGRHPKYDAAPMCDGDIWAADTPPPPARTRQFPSHQSYDHLVAMRQLED